jgi:hypothetical protein
MFVFVVQELENENGTMSQIELRLLAHCRSFEDINFMSNCEATDTFGRELAVNFRSEWECILVGNLLSDRGFFRLSKLLGETPGFVHYIPRRGRGISRWIATGPGKRSTSDARTLKVILLSVLGEAKVTGFTEQTYLDQFCEPGWLPQTNVIMAQRADRQRYFKKDTTMAEARTEFTLFQLLFTHSDMQGGIVRENLLSTTERIVQLKDILKVLGSLEHRGWFLPTWRHLQNANDWEVRIGVAKAQILDCIGNRLAHLISADGTRTQQPTVNVPREHCVYCVNDVLCVLCDCVSIKCMIWRLFHSHE